MTMPNFLIIGAPKAGTTALYNYLKQHPQIYMSPVKEPGFFAFENLRSDSRKQLSHRQGFTTPPPGSNQRYQELLSNAITDLDTYQALFDGVRDEIAIGEASPAYIYHPRAPERIHHYIPEAKLIAILRHPVERAYSSFVHRVQQGIEPLHDFQKVIETEDYSKRDDVWWGKRHYIRTGFYFTQMQRYFDTFPKSQIKVYLYDDLVNDALGLVQDLFRYLGVGDEWVPDVTKKYLVSGLPKNQALDYLLNQPNPIKKALKSLLPPEFRQGIYTQLQQKNIEKPPLLPEVRDRLNQLYREDMLQLQELIARDLSHWIK